MRLNLRKCSENKVENKLSSTGGLFYKAGLVKTLGHRVGWWTVSLPSVKKYRRASTTSLQSFLKLMSSCRFLSAPDKWLFTRHTQVFTQFHLHLLDQNKSILHHAISCHLSSVLVYIRVVKHTALFRSPSNGTTVPASGGYLLNTCTPNSNHIEW